MKTMTVGNRKDNYLKLAVARALMFSSSFADVFARRLGGKPVLKMPRLPLFKPTPRIIRVLKITAGRNHAWCESDKGIIRKPIWSIPAGIVAEYRGGGCEHT
jgi:hypothetical protein